jgi:prephenate dehydrogenase
MEGETLRRVVVVGTGLIGTSIALALRGHGVEVLLADRDGEAVRLAAGVGAGTPLPGGVPGYDAAPADLAVLAVPPGSVPSVLLDVQKRALANAYTDVAGVKQAPVSEAARLGCDLRAFVGGHPLAGRELAGPLAAKADLFRGRPWVLCPTAECDRAAVAAATVLVRACGATPVTLGLADHDRAMAVISHAPHAVASALAARFADAPESIMCLAGKGARDVTRIAAGDAGLWLEIMSANAEPIAAVLEEVARDLVAAASALRADRTDSGGAVGELLLRGQYGYGRIPVPAVEA